MKFLSIFLLLALSAQAFAQRNPRQARGRSNSTVISQHEVQGIKMKVLKLADRVAILTKKEIHSLNRAELKDLQIVLRQAKAILKGTVIVDEPLPLPSVVCSQDYDLNLFHQTYAKIQNLADNELGYFTTQARSFSNQWTQKYPCLYAAEYEDKIITLKDFADNQLGYFTTQARAFAKSNVDKLCLDQDYAVLFRAHYRFADEQLGYFSTQARKYAWDKTKGQMLSCDIGVLY